MPDIFTPEKRSYVMSRIRSNNTSIELKMELFLKKIDCHFVKYPKIYGSPDFIIPDKKIAIFCDGDFWHGHYYALRKTKMKRYWKEKIEKNMIRDKKISRGLRTKNWSVLRFWEHDIKMNPEVCINKLLRKINERKIHEKM